MRKIIKAQPQRQPDVHQDELCPPNKRYALMDANKKIDLHNPVCPNESKILANIFQNQPLRFNIVASSSVPWIYLGKFWHTLKEDGSKYRLSFVLYRKELTMTLDDFRTIFQLPQATNNNHERFVAAPKFSEMVPFFLNDLVTGYDQPLLQIMQMLYCFVNNVHVDYANLLSEGLHYSLEHPSTLIPYLRFTKLIVSHYMTAYPEISRRVRDKYHNLEHDEMVKSIFNSGKNKAGVGMKIPRWMITDEMKLTKNYQMYAEVLRVDVPTQGTHRTTSASKSLNPDVDKGESSAQQKSTIIRLHIPPRRKSHDDLEAKQNEEKVKEHLIAEEIEKMVEGTENVENDEVVNSVLNNQNDPNTRLDLGSYKESPEVKKTVVEQPVNVIEVEDDYELRRRVKGKNVLTVTDSKSLSSTPSSSSPKPTLSIYLFGHLKTRFLERKKFNVLAQHLQEVMEESLPNMVDDRVKELTKTQVPLYVAEGLIMERKHNQADVAKMIADTIQQDNAITNHIPSQVDSSVRSYMSDNPQLQHDDLPIWLALKIEFEGLHASNTHCRSSAIRPRDQDDPYDDAHPEGENSAKRQKTSEHGTYVFGESSSGQANESEPGPSTSEMSETVDEAKLRKVVDEMLRQRCTSGDEHQYHIDQMQNFLKNDIVWESRK
ncbi:hypothetical protein Tco_0956698 [Tanacetum coccineum]